MLSNIQKNNSPGYLYGLTEKIFLAIILHLAFPHIHAQAALVERDWLAPNDAALTYDTATGLEWLDLTLTSDQSYNEVSLQFGNGGAYEGFVYASALQVSSLYDSADLPVIILGQSPEWPKIRDLLDIWGTLWFLGTTGGRSEFIIADTDGLPAGQHWTGRLVYTEFGDAGVALKEASRDDDYKNPVVGSALVRAALPVAVDGDVNRDGATNLGDLLIVRQIILENETGPNNEPGHADYYPPGSPDGIINLSDLVLMQDIIQ